jgi:hypothetical protein
VQMDSLPFDGRHFDGRVTHVEQVRVRVLFTKDNGKDYSNVPMNFTYVVILYIVDACFIAALCLYR